jgi:hypothetical protein
MVYKRAAVFLMVTSGLFNEESKARGIGALPSLRKGELTWQMNNQQ